MGVENNCFFLALHDPSIQGLDPHDPNLTSDQIHRIGIESSQNPWYVFREVFRAPAQSGIKTKYVEFNRANLALWWLFLNHITIILIQPRQTGKSFCTDLLMILLKNFICRNTTINLLTKDDSLRRKNIQRLKDIYSELPPYFNFKTRTDANNTEQITINRFGNVYDTHVPQPAEKAAEKVGRGITTPIFHLDEPPYQSNIHVSFSVAMLSMGAAIQQAKDNNEPWGVIMTTTAGKKDSKEGRFVYDYANAGADWSERFYDAENLEALNAMVRVNSKGNVIRVFATFSYKQLGKTDEWLRAELERSNSTPEAADRDLFNIWTSGSESSPLSVKILETLNKNITPKDCDSITPIGGYIIDWYVPEDQITRYMRTKKTIVGVDTSDGGDGDAIGFVVTDVESGAVVAKAMLNELSLSVFARFLVWWLETYENSTMIIERRSSGATIIDYLLELLPQKGIDPFKRLFNWIVNNYQEHPEKQEELKKYMSRRDDSIYVRWKKYFGFATSGGGETSRTDLYSTTLQNAAKRCADKVRDKALTEQLTGLVTRNGRIDHDAGGHDDLVIAWLLTHWMLNMAKNLNHYDIDSKLVLSSVLPEAKLTPLQQYLEQKQQEIRRNINELFEKLSAERDPLICQRYEQELRYLDKNIILKDQEYFSVDAVITQAKEERKKIDAASPYQYGGKSIYEKAGYSSSVGTVTSGLSDMPLQRNNTHWY